MRTTTAALTLVLAFAATAIHAQSYPTKPLRMIVPSLPGGGFDVTGRTLADKMGPLMGTQMIVENRTGAGTVVGTETVAKAPADGYTVLVGGLSNIALNPALYEKLSYAGSDFRPIGLAVAYSYTLIGRKDLAPNTLRELIDYGKANPGKLTYGGASGTGQHIAASALFGQTGVNALSIFYKGASAVYQDLLGGRVDLYFDNTQTARPHIEKGAVKAYATSSPVRHTYLPNLPTVTETGVAKLDMETWFGPFVVKATPAPIVARLRAEFVRTMAMNDVVGRFENTGGRVITMAQDETEKYVAAEIVRWLGIVKAAGIKIQE
jgi:tripartite-type tricarboxylate transporter receptor subunit TctC